MRTTYRRCLITCNQIFGQIGHLRHQGIETFLFGLVEPMESARHNSGKPLYLETRVGKNPLFPFRLRQAGLDQRPKDSVAPFGLPRPLFRSSNLMTVLPDRSRPHHVLVSEVKPGGVCPFNLAIAGIFLDLSTESEVSTNQKLRLRTSGAFGYP